MIRYGLKQFKWRRNILPFKLCTGALVAVYLVNPSVAQAAACDQQLAPLKQLSSQPICQCACSCLQSTPTTTPNCLQQSTPTPPTTSNCLQSTPPHKRLHAYAPAPCKHVHPAHSVPPVHSARLVHSVPPAHSARLVHSVPPHKHSSSSTALYKPLSSPLPHEDKSPPPFISKLESRYKVIFQVGAFNSSQGRTQDVRVNNVYDIYTITNHNSQNVLLGLGYYIDGFNKPRYSLWYGLNAFYLAPSTVKGDVIQEGLYPNLSYRYTVTQFPIYLDMKGIIHTNSPKYDVTLDLGVGPSIVRTSDVEEYALNPSSVPDKIFKGSTRILPSASAGVGFKVNNVFANEASVECGYRFFYTAQTKFNNYFDSTPTSGPLHTGNNFVNAVMCSVIL